MCVFVCVCVNEGKEFDSLENIIKQHNYEGKLTLKRFSFNEPSSGLMVKQLLIEQRRILIKCNIAFY